MSAPRLDLWLLPPEGLERWSARAWASVSPQEAQRAAGLHDAGERARALGRRAFLRAVLGPLCGCAAAALALETGPGGKPCLRDGALHFNLSEAGGWVLLAVADLPVGADLERLEAGSGLRAVWRRYFGPEAVAFLEALPPGERDSAFLRRWTRLEALLKLDGRGLAALEEKGQAWSEGRARAWVLELDLGAGLCASVALPEQPGPWRLWRGPEPDDETSELPAPSQPYRG